MMQHQSQVSAQTPDMLRDIAAKMGAPVSQRASEWFTRIIMPL